MTQRKATSARSLATNRVWKDAAGKTLAEGRAFVVADGRVGISKVAGGTMTLLIDDLADTDRQYLAAHVSDPTVVAEKSDRGSRVATR